MKNEAIETLNHYFRNHSNTVFFLGSNVGVEMLSDFFRNGKIFTGDAPDMVILKDDTAIIVEHFEFDSSYTNKKGSSSRIEQARIEREIQEKMTISNEYIHQDTINTSFTYQDYVSNVTKNFLHHYNQIETYKQNLINKKIITTDTIVKTMFLIEDVSPIGSMAFDIYKNNGEMVPIILARCPEFLELIYCHNQVDYVLCCSYSGDSEYVWFIDRSEISFYINNQLDYANMKFFGNHTCVVEFRVDIPNDGG